jgi:hypothetical protein
MRNKDYHGSIEGNKMFFYRNGGLLFTATVNGNNTALLDGVAEPTQFAGLISTCALDVTLWHRHVAHLNFGDVQQLISKLLVSGLTIKSYTSPDPICEPCIARPAALGGEQSRFAYHNTTWPH